MKARLYFGVFLFPPHFLLLLPLLSFLLSIPCRLRQGRRLACSCPDSDSNESYAKQGETVPSPILSLSEAILSLSVPLCVRRQESRSAAEVYECLRSTSIQTSRFLTNTCLFSLSLSSNTAPIASECTGFLLLCYLFFLLISRR